MPHHVKRIARTTGAKAATYAGPAGELVMDITNNDLVLQNGQAGGVRLAKASTVIDATNGVNITTGGTLGDTTVVSGVDASTSAKGVVQLSNATDGTSQTMAATPKAVSDALQAAKDYADTAGAPYSGTAPIAVDATNRVISVTDASTSAKGVVQLSNVTDGTSQTMAATPKAVSDALQAAKDYADTMQQNAANRDVSNLTAAGKAAMAHAAMPSREYVTLSVPPSGGNITAPGDGYIVFGATPPSTATSPYIGLVAQGGGVSSRMLCRINIINYVFVPVSAGDQISVVYSEVSNLGLHYFYCNGNKP